MRQLRLLVGAVMRVSSCALPKNVVRPPSSAIADKYNPYARGWMRLLRYCGRSTEVNRETILSIRSLL
jgi:hypothetical protein